MRYRICYSNYDRRKMMEAITVCFNCYHCNAYMGIPEDASKVNGTEFECTLIQKNIYIEDAGDFTACKYFVARKSEKEVDAHKQNDPFLSILGIEAIQIRI